MAVSVPVEAKDELAETGLEVLGAQPVADAPKPDRERQLGSVQEGPASSSGNMVISFLRPIPCLCALPGAFFVISNLLEL